MANTVPYATYERDQRDRCVRNAALHKIGLDAWACQRKWAELRGRAERVRRLRRMAAGYRENGNHEFAAHYAFQAEYAESQFLLEAGKLRARLREERHAKAQREGLVHLQGIFDQAAD